MTRDDIIRMAREAGYGLSLSDMHAPALERFAALVAAAEREKNYALIEILIEAEREARARMVDSFDADAIRARGKE